MTFLKSRSRSFFDKDTSLASAFFFLLLVLIAFSSCDDSNKLEDNAVVLTFKATQQEVNDGIAKTVRAPDGKFYQLILPKGVKDKTPLRLPPKVAARYDYPLYFRVMITEEASSKD